MNQFNVFEYFGVADLESAFTLGVCFLLWILIFVSLTDSLYGVLQWLHQKRVLHFCALRHFTEDAEAFAPCHVRNCPHRSMCEFWEPMPPIWIRLRNWAKKKKP